IVLLPYPIVSGYEFWVSLLRSRCGLLVRSRLRGQKVPDTKPDFGLYVDPPCIWDCSTLNHTQWPRVLPLVWCESLERCGSSVSSSSSDRSSNLLSPS
ncbi:hypothetical protein AVEN_48203-1, partial [Araneus ventricosus]